MTSPPEGAVHGVRSSREVGCQWESPVEEKREVGCQSDPAERRDAGVQVDLLTQQLSDSSGVLLTCLSVRPDGPDGGALLRHCTTAPRSSSHVKPCIKRAAAPPASSPSPAPARARSQRRRRPPRWREEQQAENTAGRRSRRQHQVSADAQQEGQLQQEEEDVSDPTWTPPSAADSQGAPVPALKLEADSSVCEVCGKVMKNKSSLARHSFIHTGRKPYGCHLCQLRFNRRDNLQHHLARLHPNGVARLQKQRQVQTWLCEVCGKTFNCRSRLKTHEVIHSGVKPHHCDLCPKAYMRLNDLEHHKRTAHLDGGRPQASGSLLCDFCGKEFKCRSQLQIHLQTHTGERPHLCDICGRKFGRHYQLKRHKVLVHAARADGDGSPSPQPDAFPCGVCGKRLKSEALLVAHAGVHGGDKPHRCSLCLRSFLRATCLKQHHLRVHLKLPVSRAPVRVGSPAAPAAFPCPVCGKVFRFRSLLAGHTMIHSEVRPHACDFCSRRFRRLSHLKRHRELVHSNGARLPENFVCHICGKDKKCRSQLARHVIVHTGERPFACDLCSARFNRRGNLQQHRRRMHGVGLPAAEPPLPVLFDDDDDLPSACKQEEAVVTRLGAEPAAPT
ncbi:zinc finger protein 83-like [Synchiropus splendidus]|uniref:zinc finger protein 83-like n=1 Tax=Synchiropus splendidus TaxID=270530 RepID=UPI00237DBE05|nr:zinc finger protein 83-like [Synchiropus splendidus]XP_053717177.1 zinc finger protein 83-like [Synchiropus splendidus]